MATTKPIKEQLLELKREYDKYVKRVGLGKAYSVFGEQFNNLLAELNAELGV